MASLNALAIVGSNDLDPALPTSAGATVMVAVAVLAVVALLAGVGFLLVRLTR